MAGIETSIYLGHYMMQTYVLASLPSTAFGGDVKNDLRLRLSGCDYDGAVVLTAYHQKQQEQQRSSLSLVALAVAEKQTKTKRRPGSLYLYYIQFIRLVVVVIKGGFLGSLHSGIVREGILNPHNTKHKSVCVTLFCEKRQQQQQQKPSTHLIVATVAAAIE